MPPELAQLLGHQRGSSPPAFRGKGRYYRRLARLTEEFTLELDGDTWFNYWHHHVDWPGHGNRGWRHRRPHLEALAKVFSKVLQAARGWEKPYQTWLMLSLEDAGEDAVYLHTPNPHESPFPYRPRDTTWALAALEDFLRPRLGNVDVRAGQCGSSLIAYVKGCGVALE